MDEIIYSVTQITREIKSTLENNDMFSNIWIRGEIYNLTYHSSGHIYFTLKDDKALIAATFFRNANRGLAFKLEEGMDILARGNISVYEKRGSYQLNVSQVRLEGIGELQKKIEQLKKKLLEEGIFDHERKRPLPFLPRRLGIVTSPTGAAIRDIIKVALRRYPSIEILLAPSKVQGDDAAATISRGIDELNKTEYGIDLIIAGRGGGSFEDLMPFNEEIVVRAFANSRVPIISAVGHQIDHPLSDDAADLAAPTPSAAAEMAVPLKRELEDEIQYLFTRSWSALNALLTNSATRLRGVTERRIFKEPAELVHRFDLLLSDIERDIADSMKDKLRAFRDRLLSIPDLGLHMGHCLKQKTNRYNMAIHSLEQLSPLAVMKRGYSITLDSNDRLIKSITQISPGDMLRLLLHDGTVSCTVTSKQRGTHSGKEKTAPIKNNL